MDYTQEKLQGLMAEVEKEFKIHLSKAEEDLKTLSKSEDESEKEKPKEEDKKKAASESSGEEKKPMETEKPEDKGIKDQDQQDTSKPEGEGDKPGSEEEGAAPGEGEDHGYDDEDMQHMHSMYSSMSKPELKAHHDVIRKCMDSMGLAKCEDGMAKAEMEDSAKDAEGYRPNGGPKDGEATSQKGPASTGAQALEKSEKDILVELHKAELESVKVKAAEEKKDLEAALQKFLTKFVEKTAPAGKAITSLDIIAKTEGSDKEKPLSKSEIDAKLIEKAKDPSLKKSDREAIDRYYCGSKNIEQVRHLLS